MVDSSKRLNVFIPELKPMSMNLVTAITTKEESDYPNSVSAAKIQQVSVTVLQNDNIRVELD